MGLGLGVARERVDDPLRGAQVPVLVVVDLFQPLGQLRWCGEVAQPSQDIPGVPPTPSFIPMSLEGIGFLLMVCVTCIAQGLHKIRCADC